MGGIIRALIRSENMQIYNIYPKYISSINTLSKTIYWTSIKHVEGVNVVTTESLMRVEKSVCTGHSTGGWLESASHQILLTQIE